MNDLSVLSKVGLFFTPSDGHKSCKRKANFVGKAKGGNGFLREVTDRILIAKKYIPNAEFFFKKRIQ